MKAKTLQIVWHSKEPVFSIDFHPDGYMATGGADKEIKIWELNCAPDGSPGVRWAASLEGHNATVNCVRFSKSGHCLASAGDSGEVIVWKRMPAAPAAADGSDSPKTSTPPLTPGTAATAAATPDAAAAAAGSPATAVKAFGSTAAAVPAKDAAAAGRDQADAEVDGVVRGFKWKMSHTLRGHHDDVCDVAWAHDDAVLLTGSVENEVMMFDVHNRQNLQRLLGHRHYVQGVAWDPLGAYLVSASADRSVRVYGLKPPGTGSKASSAAHPKSSVQLARDYIHTATLLKRTLPFPATPPQKDSSTAAAAAAAAAGSPAQEQAAAAEATIAAAEQQQQLQQAAKPLQTFLFQDESLGVFFRRMAWSADGMLLAIPAGISKGRGGAKGTQHATHVYAHGHWASPVVSLPCPAKASTAVKFCPLLFKLRPQGSTGSSNSTGAETASATAAAAVVAEGPAGEGGCQMQNVLGLPYRLVLAVATVDTVLLYDMQTLEPFMLVGPLHYDQITDLAWSRDGSCLAVSSRDGYCSVITFQPGELGDVITEQELPAPLLTSLQKVAAAAAATAAKHSAASSSAIAASPVVLRPVGPAAAAVSPVATSADKIQQQQQQQQGAAQCPAIKRIQPQAVSPAVVAVGSPAGVAALTAGAATAVKVATVASSQPRRISPSPVAASPAATAAAGSARPPSSNKAAAPALRRLTPTPVRTAAAAAALQSGEVVDLTDDDQPIAAAAAAAPAVVQGNSGSSTEPNASSSAAAAAVTAAAVMPPAPRRLTPQAVSPAGQQQQQGGASPAAAGGISPAAAAAAAPQGRTGMAAVAAALAAARKKAAAKRAAEGTSDDGADAKRLKADTI